MGKRSTIKGAASFRRMMKALPDSANRRLVTFLNAAGPPLAEKMRGEIPVLRSPRPNRTPGAGRASIQFKVTPKTLNLKVGTLNGKLRRSKLFYLHILDVGRRAQVVKVTRGSKSYPNGIRVRRMAPLFIIRKIANSFRWESLPGYRSLMESILSDAARGAGND